MKTMIGLGFAFCAVGSLAFVPQVSQTPEAPAALDGQTNGLADQTTHAADQDKVDEFEQISDGLGPLYNAQSCREWHQNPVSGVIRRTTELRVAHRGPYRQVQNP